MDKSDLAPLVMAAIATAGAITGAMTSAWKWAKARAREDLLRDQATATITAKNAELAELEADNIDLKAENARLWALLQERSR